MSNWTKMTAQDFTTDKVKRTPDHQLEMFDSFGTPDMFADVEDDAPDSLF